MIGLRLHPLLQPFEHMLERFAAQGVEDILAVALGEQHVAVLKDAQVVGGDGLLHFELLVNFSYGELFPAPEHVDNGQALRMGKGAQHFGSVFQKGDIFEAV